MHEKVLSHTQKQQQNTQHKNAANPVQFTFTLI